MVYQYLTSDIGTIPMRKYATVFDVLYTLFDNKSVKAHLTQKWQLMASLTGNIWIQCPLILRRIHSIPKN